MDLPGPQVNYDFLQQALGEAKRVAQTDPSALGQEFETVFVTQFVDEMMKTLPTSAFGGEKQAEMWRPFMSEAVAKSLVEQGGLGLAAPVQDMIGAYEAGRKTDTN